MTAARVHRCMRHASMRKQAAWPDSRLYPSLRTCNHGQSLSRKQDGTRGKECDAAISKDRRVLALGYPASANNRYLTCRTLRYWYVCYSRWPENQDSINPQFHVGIYLHAIAYYDAALDGSVGLVKRCRDPQRSQQWWPEIGSGGTRRPVAQTNPKGDIALGLDPT